MWPIIPRSRTCFRWLISGTFRFPRTLGFADTGELAQHFSDHASDFMAITESQYEAMADWFLAKAKTAAMFECIRMRGDRLRYDTLTNEFGIVSASGTIRTYFIPRPCTSLPPGTRKIKCHKRPTNMDYVRDTCAQH